MTIAPRRAGTESRPADHTIRLYQKRGLLPGPRLVGRTGFYESHLNRLGLIGRLQEQGFSLAGIGQLVQSWEQGRDLTDLIGLEAQLNGLVNRRRELWLEPVELAARFPPMASRPSWCSGPPRYVCSSRPTTAGFVCPTSASSRPDPR